MREVRITLALMIILVLLFSACSAENPMDAAKQISENFNATANVSVTANISADYGDKVYRFKLSCTKSAQETAIEIKEPESLAGMTAVCADNEYDLSFDGVQVTTGVLTRNGLSPVEALPALIDQWQTGYVTGAVGESYRGTDTIALDTHLTDDVTQRTWFDVSGLLPIHSEISQDGHTVIYCDYENVIFE